MNKLSPLQAYQIDLESKKIKPDLNQSKAIEKLNQCSKQLIQNSKLLWPFKKKYIKGLYFWGGVGRGKTYLMDLFFKYTPIQKKYRIHFHAFMQQLHIDLKSIPHEKNPLDIIAKRWASEYDLICLDEFVVTDIADVMVLSGFCKSLFESGVCLVTTSNAPPNKLYFDGFKRESFLPCIRLLEKYTEIFELDSGIDYRTKQKLDHLNLNPNQSFENLFEIFSKKTKNIKIINNIILQNRSVPCVKATQNNQIIWFEFDQICGAGRCQYDYIELAQRFSIILISDLKINLSDDQARRFSHLIDVLYDSNIQLYLLPKIDLEKLYQGKLLAFEFERIKSRLREMVG